MPIDNQCFETISVYLSATGLSKLDTFSNSDPFAVVFMKDNKRPTPTRVATTECIADTQNPQWATQLMIDYHFEMVQEMAVQVYDRDGSAPLTDLSRHDYCGEATFTLSSLMCSASQSLTLDIRNGRSRGQVVIRAEPASNTKDVFIANFIGANLANKDGFFGRSDPFLNFYRLREDGTWQIVHHTPHIDNNLNPRFLGLRIGMLGLCNGDLERPIKVEIMDHQSDGKHQYMGSFQTSVRGMMDAGGTPFDVIEEDKKKSKKSYKNSGTMSVQAVQIERNPTLTEFIAGGCEISMMVAIDYTGSNGDPASPSSLHYLHPSGQMNQYQQAISSVGAVLDPYDSDHMYPVYGFGAKVRAPNGGWSPVQHCFPVYGGGFEVAGVEGILQAYRDSVQNVALSGPTLFNPIISAACAIAAGANCSQERQKYFVLLMLTDGEINDMADTARSIIRASNLPLSIIIVGVGSADFSSMQTLDSDGGMLRVGTETATRDIVQFVPFRDYAAKGASILAQDVLAEVPNQLLSFMKRSGITPHPPR